MDDGVSSSSIVEDEPLLDNTALDGDRGAGQSQLLGPRKGGAEKRNKRRKKRWRTSTVADDYLNACSRMIVPPVVFGRYGMGPGEILVERPNLLGLIQSPLRRPSVMERWSPLEVVTFEGAISLYGKHFSEVQRAVKTKNTKEVVEFYYVWKMTSHYDKWKRIFEPDLPSPEASDGEEEDASAKDPAQPTSKPANPSSSAKPSAAKPSGAKPGNAKPSSSKTSKPDTSKPGKQGASKGKGRGRGSGK
mmetsp:Transcript_56107/g.127437  ORF Transcript_56107/g.127437 Transcript_56107/m.127437 type:complete len:247 (+) Transcript_56107:70-810(+)